MHRPRAPGFSLLELLITLSIVAILASITVPSFSGYVAKSRRTDAMSALLQVQLAQMRWRAAHREYSDGLAELGWADALSPDGHYRLRIQSSNSGDFLVQADPLGAQQSDTCGAFAISAQGPVYLAPYAAEDCWSR